ncbi:MAG TPA: hypothetical protein VLM79_14295, partial [Kofleriaceae bacterium]|nr:hypothetical protein [Kofleriaceae bacterium]
LVTSNERPGGHARAALAAMLSSRPASALAPSGRTAIRPPTARDANADLDAARTGRAAAFSSPANDAHAADAVERSVRESARTIDARRAAEEQQAAARDEAARLRDEAARAELMRHTYGAHLVSEASREAARPEMVHDALAAAPEGSIREMARPGNDVVTIVPRRHAADRPRVSSEPVQAAMLVERGVAEREARAETAVPATIHAALTTLPGPPPAPKPGPLPPPPELITPSMFRAVPPTPPPLATHPLASQPLATQLLASQPLSTSHPPSSPPPAAPTVAHPPPAPPVGSQPLSITRAAASASASRHPRPPTAPPTVPMRHPTADPTRTPDAGWTESTWAADAARPGDPAKATDAASARPTTASDPAQIAAALAAIVSRVSAAPFGMPRGPESAPSSPLANAPSNATPSAPPVDDDSRATQPRMATQPPLPGIPIPAGLSELEGYIAAIDFESRATSRREAAIDFESRTPDRRTAFSDASTTEPSIPAMSALAVGDERSVDLSPVPAAAAQGTPALGAPARPWSSELASRVDAALVDEWAHETPVVAPTSAELRVLFGEPDPTRQLPVDEIEELQRRAAELAETDRQRRAAVIAEAELKRRAAEVAAVAPRKRMPPTAEVDPEDIEAAIELAPPARRPAAKNTIGVHRPKKPERPE